MLSTHSRPTPGGTGPSWLSFIGHTTDSLWSVDLFRCESIVLRSDWVLVVMDHFTRRLVGVGVHCGPVTGADLCRMVNAAMQGRGAPRHLSADHDPLFEAHRWTANLRILEIDAIKTVPPVPRSHPFVARLIGTTRREFLDHVLFWNARDLERTLGDFQASYNEVRSHASLKGHTPLTFASGHMVARAELNNVRWVSTAGTWSSSQWRPDNEFETDRRRDTPRQTPRVPPECGRDQTVGLSRASPQDGVLTWRHHAGTDPSTSHRAANAVSQRPPVLRPYRGTHMVTWAAAKHGGRGRRGWRKLHLGVDQSGVIRVHTLTEATGEDATTALDLLTAVEGPLVRVTADAAYDTVAVYETAGARGATVVIPPAKTATVSGHGPRSPARDRTITLVKTLGRRRWKKASGYHRQGRVENAFFRYKSIIGDGLRARSPAGQGSEVVLGCEIFSRMTELGGPVSYRIGR